MSEIVEMAGDEGAPVEAKPKMSRKKLIIIGAAAGVLALGGGGGFLLLSGGGRSEEAVEASADAGHGTTEGAANYVDVPPMMVNLRSPDGSAHMLKLRFMLVPGAKGSADTLKKKLPLILDAYQPFLRELRPEDIAGSAAVFRIKEEMLMRANLAAGAGSVSDILIQDLVQQ